MRRLLTYLFLLIAFGIWLPVGVAAEIVPFEPHEEEAWRA